MAFGNFFGGGNNQDPAGGQNPGGQQPGGQQPGGNQPPPDEGTGGGESRVPNGQGHPGQQEGGEQQDVDPRAVLASLFAEEDESGDDPNGGNQPGGDQPPNNQQQQPNNQQQQQQEQDTPEKRVATDVQRMLSDMKVPDDAFPEDFDPTDPTQMRNAMTRTMQHTAAVAMQAAFKPVQLAMKNLSTEVKEEIQASLKDHSTNSQSRQMLEAAVPEAGDPELKGVVDMVWEQAKKKNKKTQDAVQATRKALDAMGIKGGKKKGQGASDPSEGDSDGYRTGQDALDIFAPMPKS